MSGGHWEYKDYALSQEVFGYDIDSPKKARKANPLKDAELSELVYDILDILHSADYCFSGDTSRKEYQADVQKFKEKWLGKDAPDRIKRNIDEELEIAKENLYESLGVEENAE